MANLILRPDNDGIYGDWEGNPSVDLWTNIDDKDPDGDATYVHTDTAGAFTCFLSNTSSRNFPRPVRIRGITIFATARALATLALTRFRFRLRYYGVDYDSDELFTTDLLTYKEFFKTYIQAPNGDGFTNSGLNTMEAGLVYVDGPGALRCTKLEIQVHHEPYPNISVGPNANGTDQTWNVEPSTAPAYMTVQGPYDGNLSYIYSNIPTDQSVFEQDDLPLVINPPTIEKISVQALVKNYGISTAQGYIVLKSGGISYLGGTSTLPLSLPDDAQWHIWTQEFLNSPSLGWPSGDPAATPWVPAEVNAIEIGPRIDSGDIRCTSLMTDVWLKHIPITTFDIFPDGNGALTDLPPLVPNTGESAWQDIDEDPPDNAGTYIGGDADTFTRAMFGTFTVPVTGAVPAGERISNVELRYRLRLGTVTPSTIVAALVRNPATQDTYIGEPQIIEGTGITWFDVVVNLGNDPFTGNPWVDSTNVTDYEYGFVIFSGECWLSRLRVQIQTSWDVRAFSDPLDLQLTDAAVALMTRSLTDGTTYAVTEFAVGTGGYDPTAPATVLPVNSADTALTSEVYRAPLTGVNYDVKDLAGQVTVAPATAGVSGVDTKFVTTISILDHINIAGEVLQVVSITDDFNFTLGAPHIAGATDVPFRGSPMTVDYFCKVPREEAVAALGEIGIWATILQSPFPSEIGTKFMFAKEHTPAQCSHDKAVHVHRVRIEYP